MSTSPLEYGPTREDMYLSSGLDYYKPTMSQLLYEQEPEAEVTFTFKNRGEQRIADYVSAEQLQERLITRQEYGWHQDELNYFAELRDSRGTRIFSDSFIEHLATSALPLPEVSLDETTNDIAIKVTGESSLVTFWETVVMSEVNELYFENYVVAHGLDIMKIYDEGDRRVSEKIAVLQANPDIKFSDFGTRRHFSLKWQRHVLQRLQAECPQNLLGTSNVGLAQTLGLKPIGTFAHEMPMVYAGLAESRGQDIRASHQAFLNAWHDRYGKDLSIALTDTFTTAFFFEDFTPEQAADWRGVRHDSGDAIAFGERVIKFYEANGIDPSTKTIVFSDGLDIDQIVMLQKHFGHRINTVYGWGTTLTNDLGLPALNIVMKATRVKTANGEASTVKLSDNPIKHTGLAEQIRKYQDVFRSQLVLV